MFRSKILFFLLITINLSFAQQNYNLIVDLGSNQSLNFRSMSTQDSLDILIDSDTILNINCAINSMFYLENNNGNKYYLYLTENSPHPTSFKLNDTVSISGYNSNFIKFFNEYVKLYQSNFDIQSLMSDYTNLDELEIYLYNLINDDIYVFFNNHQYFDFFSTESRDYFRTLLKYEYLSSISNFLFNVQHKKINLDLDNAKLDLDLVDIRLLKIDALIDSFDDSRFFGMQTFQDYSFNSLFLLALNDYNESFRDINDFQNFTLYFLNFINQYSPYSLRYIFIQKMIKNFSALIKKNTIDYIIQFLDNSNLSLQEIESISNIFLENYNQNLDSDFNLDSQSLTHDFYIENKFGETYNLDGYLGSVLYVDIWASWCGPCRKQFPYSKDLKSKFSKRQQKKIKFVYISIDNDLNKWKESLEKLDLEGEHFISPASHPKSAANYFQAFSIPRYILIDKNGNILNMNAKRPSDIAIYDELLELLD